MIHYTSDHLQQLLLARICSLVLLKGKKLADDYGHGRPTREKLLGFCLRSREHRAQRASAKKAQAYLPAARTLRVTFYGRLEAYKGVDHMLRALRFALDLEGSVLFRYLWTGCSGIPFQELTCALGLESVVKFHGAVPFGRRFSRLCNRWMCPGSAPFGRHASKRFGRSSKWPIRVVV